MQDEFQYAGLKYCPQCEMGTTSKVVLLTEGKHYAKEVCSRCGAYRSFVKKPENENKRGKNRFSPAGLGIDFCQLCLRPTNRLGDRGVLEVHHVEQIQNGGEDAPGNIWVCCTSCHRLIHHQRTYLNEHTRKYISEKELLEMADKYGLTKEMREMLVRVFRKHEAINGR